MHSEELAVAIAQETGKPLWETRTEAGAMVGKIAIAEKAFLDRTGDVENQMVELPFNGSQIGEDIGMVKLQVVHDQRTRAVMNKLGAFVEKRRVVLIRLDDEERCIAQASGELPQTPNSQAGKDGFLPV